ncbi:MAG: hypothetical protein IPP17_30265 [Bacteroidetes bacterium]|nr:hypothetical protein [Bacteroidota bacterium]
MSRHSDHHYRAGRKYQTLRHMEGSPQMPTGYPGMLVLAVFPHFVAVMHRELTEAAKPSAEQDQLART